MRTAPRLFSTAVRPGRQDSLPAGISRFFINRLFIDRLLVYRFFIDRFLVYRLFIDWLLVYRLLIVLLFVLCLSRRLCLGLGRRGRLGIFFRLLRRRCLRFRFLLLFRSRLCLLLRSQRKRRLFRADLFS